MKVLHVVYNSHPDTTGAAIRTGWIARTQARLGVSPVVLSSPFQPPADPAAARGVEYWHDIPHYRCYTGANPARFMAAGKPWWERARKLARLGGFTLRIAQVARRERVGLIHAHNLFFCGLAAVAAGRLLGLPVVYEVRSLVEEGADGAGPWLRAAWRRADLLACRLATHVVVLCRALEEEMIRRGVPPGKITVAGNGVDLEAHSPLHGGGCDDHAADAATAAAAGNRVETEARSRLHDNGVAPDTAAVGNGVEMEARSRLHGNSVEREAHPLLPAGDCEGHDLEAHSPAYGAGREDVFARGAPRSFVLGYIGTLAAYEGLDLLIDAAAVLAPRHPRLRVLLVGDGPARAALESRAHRLSLGEVIRFAGRVSEEAAGRYYRGINLFVLPRRASSITDRVTPLKPLEIMAHGSPLLAGDCGGHRELILDGVNGALFPAGDPAVLAGRIEGMMADPEGLAALGRRAREWVARHRTWESQCRPVVDLYERLAARRRILLVAPAPPPPPAPTGGVENGVGMILRSWLAERHDIRLWDRAPRPGPRAAWPVRLVRHAWQFARFAGHLAARRPDVVHIKSSSGVNFIHSAVFAALARLLGRRVLLQLHSGEFEQWRRRQNPAARWAIRMALRVPAEILVLSQYWHDLMARLVPGRPIRVVPNGVEVPPAPPAREGRNGAITAVTIGAVGAHKGHYEILEAASRLRGRPIRFLVAGPDGAGARRRAAELGLSGSVSFLGPLDPNRKWDLLASADVFLLPSRAEGMPNALLEAMASGLPALATPVGSIPEMLSPAQLVPVGDVEALADKLLELAADPARRRELGLANRERVQACYRFDRVARMLDAAYRGESDDLRSDPR